MPNKPDKPSKRPKRPSAPPKKAPARAKVDKGLPRREGPARPSAPRSPRVSAGAVSIEARLLAGLDETPPGCDASMPVPGEPPATAPLPIPDPIGSEPTERLVPLREEPPASSAPPTRRSSPRPPVRAAGAPEVRVPPLPRARISIEEAPPRGAEPPPELLPGFDLDSDEMRDVAPIAATTAFFPDASGAASSVAGSDLPPAPSGPVAEAGVEEIERQIRELEAKLDRMIQQGGGARRDAELDSPAAPRGAAEPAIPEPSPSGSVLETAREILSTDYVLRQWGKLGLRNRSEEVDEFGLDPKYEARFRPMLDFLYDMWFRVDTEGATNVPDEGRCIVVANHSGGPLPYDGLMLRTTVRREHPRQRDLRWLAEDFIYYLPFVGAFMNRVGAVRACQENAERLLSRGRAIAVFPEGAKGIGKLYRDRYRLQRFGRGGFIKLCLRTQTPLVPCAVVGAEESSPMLYKVENMAKAFGIPYLPITPTFPAFGPLGLLPAPTKWKVRFGEAMRFDEYGPEAADDEVLVARLTERVRATIQVMLDRTVGERRSIWFG